MKSLTPKFHAVLIWLVALLPVMAFAQGNNTVTVCHNGNTIQVNANAVQAHLNHGDQLGACAGSCINPDLINPDLFCLMVYNPVCGCDGNTYSNACVATNFYGVTSYTPGECNSCLGEPMSVFCPTYVDPVCGCNGVTYSNACFAAAAGVRSYTPGACGSSTSGKQDAGIAMNGSSLVPNPASDWATVSWMPIESAEAQVIVMDMLGKTVYSSSAIATEAQVQASHRFQVSDLQAGMYLVQIQGQDHSVTQRLTVTH